MKTDLTTYGSMLQTSRLPQKGGVPLKGKEAAPIPKDAPDYKVELSPESKPSTSTGLQAPSLPVPSIPSPPTPNASKPDIPKEAKDVKKLEKVKEIMDTKVQNEKRPLVIFIKGLDVFSSPSKSERGYAGVGKMAESVEGARIYGWNQQDEIIKEINKIHRDYPVILVGHSLGGDTAMEVADELDSLDHDFRKVDLLVTIDSVGFNNDIVPQNVKNHLNIFGEKDFFLNDDPHVARNHEQTKVKNILASHDHTEIDDDKAFQFEIINLINETVSKAKA